MPTLSTVTTALGTGAKALSNAASAVQSAIIFKNSFSSQSIAKLSKDSIMLYPLLISNDVTIEDTILIAKSLERQYASFLLLILSMEKAVDLSRYPSIKDYLRRFHDNQSIPQRIRDGGNVLRNVQRFVTALSSTMVAGEQPEIVEANHAVLEAMSIRILGEESIVKIPNDVILECWSYIRDEVTTESLNDMYQPFKATEKKMESAIMEADSILSKVRKGMNAVNYNNNNTVDYRRVATDDKTPKNATASTAVKELKDTKLEPTLVECQLLITGKGATKDDSKYIDTVMFGVKTMVRQIDKDIVVSNLADATTGSKFIFKFIKWAKGESNWAKDLLKIGEAREDAKKTKEGERLFAALKRKKAKGFAGAGLPPTTTVVISTQDAERIKTLTGVDLNDAKNAAGLMSSLNLLGFGIVDNPTKSMSILYDGYEEFNYVAMASLKASGNKDTTLADIKDILKVLGARM